MTPEVIERLRIRSGPLQDQEKPAYTHGFDEMIPPVDQYLRFVSVDHNQLHRPDQMVSAIDIIRRGDASDERAFYRFCKAIDATMFSTTNPDYDNCLLYPYAIGMLYREEMAWRQEFRQLPDRLSVTDMCDVLGVPVNWVRQQLARQSTTPSQQKRQKNAFLKTRIKHLRYEKLTSPDIPDDRISLLDIAGYFDHDEVSLESIARDHDINVDYHAKDGLLVATIPDAALDQLDELAGLGVISDADRHILRRNPEAAAAQPHNSSLQPADVDDTGDNWSFDEIVSPLDFTDHNQKSSPDPESRFDATADLVDLSDSVALSALLAEINRCEHSFNYDVYEVA